MKNIKSMLLFIISVFLASCEKNMDLDMDRNQESELQMMLNNTSWKLEQHYVLKGNSRTDHNRKIGSILYFSPEIFGSANGYTNTASNALLVDNIKCGYWWADKTKIYVQWARGTAMLNGEYLAVFGPFPNLKYINTSEMVLESYFDFNDSYERWVYSRITGGGGADTGGGSTSYEAPNVYYYDSTPGYTNMKVQFKIGNKERTKVTEAKGYCGSKTVSGNIGSSIITFNFSNLQRGTKYNIYCKVSGPGGTSTSDVVTLSTLN